MKTTHETATVDRISTHEELHQVLALLNESASRVRAEASSESEQEDALQDAVSSLWQDATEDGQSDLEGEAHRWAELASKTERVN